MKLHCRRVLVVASGMLWSGDGDRGMPTVSSASVVLLRLPEAEKGQGSTAVVSGMLFKRKWRGERDGSEVNFTFSEVPERNLIELLEQLRPGAGLCLEVVCEVREGSGVKENGAEAWLI